MIEIGLGHYLTLGAVIFFWGVIGIFLNRKNIIVILMSVELILLAVNINLISSSGCCFLIAICFLLSAAKNLPFVSIIIPLFNTKSGV